MQGPLSFIGTIIIAIALWILSPHATLPLAFIIPSWILMVIIIIILIESAHASYKMVQNMLPQVLNARRESERTISCLLEPSELFSQNTLVSMYYKDDSDFEVLVAIGFVRIIQSDGKIQIELNNIIEAYGDIMNRFANNDEQIKKRIQIKTGIPVGREELYG